ncbi:SMC-Scp complex subunit ScpB [Schinkia azotoformans]|uniref:Segregation and condensation protein B n=1 Tax=Schinkia azotoformans LMG 9581 TaxID=1131731 RepID=K6CS67_SCHAZ|nr:SMC-Scp complex subunit ScpB [Schinkia azotoformans]EKN63082.1 segregation and condensation protein B [Schinkia azotoformans LMG 9581]MEC1640443.1 SMC-Scp complex subunit ScpB [Schinkia azotoformans]MEC1723043.1 SMC-Scp complex subunit ScpB [Schinkia azotoformans]MEC1944672.1 SMC-Scp complex subunit ScpB [Schinkia azotoformans]MED4352725.1 SMC-Scp complex subunit ScpB [Schinkia azotoformans]
MKLDKMKAIVEGLLFIVGDEGIDSKQIADVLQISEIVAVELIENLKADYTKKSRGIDLVEVAGVYQLTTKREHAEYFKRLVESPTTSTLSQAALETLAIIAYKQPITRAEIEEIRGVKTERPLSTLMSKSLIKEVGRAEGTGRAYLYGTTKDFLEYFGLKTLDELPPLPEKLNEEDIRQEEADLFFEKFQETFAE